MPTPYASVGGDDADLAQHALAVRRGRLPLSPTVEGVSFSLDVDPSGALLGVTSADGTDTAVPGFWAAPVTTVVVRDLLADREDFWRSRLVGDVPGAEPVPVVTGLVDLAHAGPGAYRRGRSVRLRLSLAAERVAVGGADRPAGLSCAANHPVAEVSGVVRAAARRTSGRTGRPFTVLTVETAGLALDVCAAPEVLAELPAAGTTVTAAGRLTGVFAGTVGELAPELSPETEPPLVVTARPAAVPRTPVALTVPGDGDRPVSTPLLELARHPGVLAPLVHTAGATDAGVLACCADWEGRWQLRRFPPGATAPDAGFDLPGAPSQCVVHRGGAAVLAGRELLVLDAGLRLLHRATFPPEGALQLVASPATVHVLVTEAAGPADAPDDAGRRAAAQGATVHRYKLHRLELARLADPMGNPWQKTDLPVSGIYPASAQTEVPGWVEPTPADTRGEGFWFAVPGRDAWDRPAQHHLTVTAEGALALHTDSGGPPWSTARLRHGDLLLTGDAAGPAVDGARPPSAGRVGTRLLAGPVPAAVAVTADGSGTHLYELRDGAWTPVAATPGGALGSAATDPRTGARWYALAGAEQPAVLGVVADGGALRPVLQTREPAAVVAAAGDAVVVTAPLPGAPLLDLRDGRLTAPGQPAPPGALRPLPALLSVGTAS